MVSIKLKGYSDAYMLQQSNVQHSHHFYHYRGIDLQPLFLLFTHLRHSGLSANLQYWVVYLQLTKIKELSNNSKGLNKVIGCGQCAIKVLMHVVMDGNKNECCACSHDVFCEPGPAWASVSLQDHLCRPHHSIPGQKRHPGREAAGPRTLHVWPFVLM